MRRRQAVGSFRNRALGRHLTENAATIGRELRSESELLRLLADEMISDRKARQNDDRRTKVTLPFRDATALPENWDQYRKFFLMAELDIAKARAAQDAARQL